MLIISPLSSLNSSREAPKVRAKDLGLRPRLRNGGPLALSHASPSFHRTRIDSLCGSRIDRPRRVLVAGGVDAGGLNVASAELYDPVSRTFTLTNGSIRNGEWEQAGEFFLDELPFDGPATEVRIPAESRGKVRERSRWR